MQSYRGTWVYQYGSMIALLIFYGGVLGALINTILLIVKHKTELRNNLTWIFLSAVPWLYTGIMIVITMN